MIRCDLVVYLQVVLFIFSLVLIWSPCKGGIFVLLVFPQALQFKPPDCADSLQLVSPARMIFVTHVISHHLPDHQPIPSPLFI